jgi:membrane-associated protease RseP (regulator of RpoE activity)
MNDVNLALFQYDYDVTWMCFFLNANQYIHSRYGGRDARGAEERLSVAGLKHTMRRVLVEHAVQPDAAPAKAPRVTYARQLFAKDKGCIHCHHVWEGIRKQARAQGAFDTNTLYYVYPPPDNLGLKLDVTEGDKVVGVVPDSPGQRAGLRPGDRLLKIQDVKIISQGDVFWALHNAPAEGRITVQWRRDDTPHTATLDLPRGWRQSDLSWRASIRRDKKK